MVAAGGDLVHLRELDTGAGEANFEAFGFTEPAVSLGLGDAVDQPWVVYGLLRTEDAVNPAPGLTIGLWVVTAVYVLLTITTVGVLRGMTRSTPVPVAPQESDVESYRVV